MARNILHRQIIVLVVVGLVIVGCVDDVVLEPIDIVIPLSTCPPECGRLPTPDESYEMENIINNDIRACGGETWDAVADDLINLLYQGRLLVYPDSEATDPYVLGFWDPDWEGGSQIWVTDWHWSGGTLNEEEMGKTLAHEGTHETVTGAGHETPFWSHYYTCYAN